MISLTSSSETNRNTITSPDNAMSMGLPLTNPTMIPSTLFYGRQEGQEGQRQHQRQQQRQHQRAGQKRDLDSSFILRSSCFDISSHINVSHGKSTVTSNHGNGNGNCNSTSTLRKALSLLASGPFSLQQDDDDCDYDCDYDCDENDNVMSPKSTSTSTSDSVSVSTASTTDMMEESSYDENSDRDSDSDSDTEVENDQEKHQDEHQENVPITGLPPDALFMVQGVEFPCHTKMLSSKACGLLDILESNGVLERKTKKQRTSSMSQPQDSNDDDDDDDEQLPAWSSPSGITIAELPTDIYGVDADTFRVMMEFLYNSNEISLMLPEDHEDVDENDPWLMDEEDVVDDFYYDDENDDDDDDLDLPSSSQSQEETKDAPTTPTTQSPMKFLQGLYIAANQFGCVSLKHAVEDKLYDEFLYAFTAQELLLWADEHKCAFLKEKAMDKIINKNKSSASASTTTTNATTTSDEWKRLQEELFLYEKTGCHEIRYVKFDDDDDDTIPSTTVTVTATVTIPDNTNFFYKVEYLRHCLSELGLDVDGTREMLEQ